MRLPTHPAFWLAVVLPLASAAQDSADLGAALADPKNWAVSSLAGDWRQTGSDAKIRTLAGAAPIFGIPPQTAQASFENGALAQIDITYLEAGNFFASQAARDAGQKKARKEFEARFKSVEAVLLGKLSALYGAGQRRNVGKSQLLRSRVTDFTAGSVVVRLYAEEDQLVSISILPAQAAAQKLAAATAAPAGVAERRTETQANVARLANGDVVVQNVPAVDQGDRGYCAIGTLTMITRYYGLPVNVDLIAAKAGYKEGDVSNANLHGVYSACAKEAKLRLKTDRSFDFRKAKKHLLKGGPIIVGRRFDRVREEFHSRFAMSYQKDPTVRLPKADRGERARWPASSAGAHASVITGFNEERSEVLFTESWGEAARNRRMLAEEMEATAFEVHYFTP